MAKAYYTNMLDNKWTRHGTTHKRVAPRVSPHKVRGFLRGSCKMNACLSMYGQPKSQLQSALPQKLSYTVQERAAHSWKTCSASVHFYKVFYVAPVHHRK